MSSAGTTGKSFLSTLSLRRATKEALQKVKDIEFLSTLSLRRATNVRITHNPGPGYFYPRSPCGERLERFRARLVTGGISIHALLAESDVKFQLNFINQKEFLSTLSLRRATSLGLLGWLRVLISIHALLAESDPPRRPEIHQ